MISTVAVSLLGSMVFAGPKYEITPMVGKKLYNYSDDSPRFDDGQAVLGGRANIYFNDTTSVQLGVEGSKDNPIAKPNRAGATTDLLRGMVSIQKDIPTKGRVTPYVFGGLGGEKIYKPEATTNVDSQMFYNGGAGLRYNVNDKVDLVAETRVIRKVEDDDTDIIGNVGVGFKFGNRAKSIQDLAALTPPKPVTPVAPVAPVAPPAVIEEPVEEAPSIIVGSLDEKESAVSEEVIDSDCGDVADVTATCGSDRDTSSSSVSSGYYIQVISLARNSTDPITRRLDSKGFAYTLEDNGSNTRVLVGPYSSRSAARSALRRLKRIRRDAFIVSR
jgi:opacity protein-like surface antigen